MMAMYFTSNFAFIMRTHIVFFLHYIDISAPVIFIQLFFNVVPCVLSGLRGRSAGTGTLVYQWLDTPTAHSITLTPKEM